MKNKLIELICEAVREHNCEAHCNCNCIKVEIIADHLIANGVTVQQWIPVSERLPEEREGWCNTFSDTVLVAHKRHDGSIRMTTSCTIDGKWHSDVQHIQYEITHWMPLPEPPKEN